MKIPSLQSKKWSFAQEGDFYGNVLTSKNIDFDDLGYAKLGQKAQVLLTDATSNFGRIFSIVPDDANNQYLLCTLSGHFEYSPDNTAFNDVSTSDPANLGTGSDGVLCFERNYVSSGQSGTELKYFDGSSWNATGITLASSVPHPLCQFVNKNRLAVAGGNTVTLYNSSHSANSDVLTIPIDYVIVWMRWRQNQLYIGTRAKHGRAKMFIWNGTGTDAQYAYGTGAAWMYSGAEFDNSICTVTSSGQLLRFNGGGFDVLANFPIYYLNRSWIGSDSVAGSVPHRGMTTDGNVLYINIDGSAVGPDTDVRGRYIHKMPSGLWVYDPDVGLYPRATSVHTKFLNLSVSSVSSNTFTMASAHEAETGDYCMVSNPGSLTGITDEQIYYVIKVSSTELQLAYSLTDALNGNEIVIGGTVGGATIKFDTYTSYGASFNTQPGAITTLSIREQPQPFHASGLLWGATVVDNDNNSVQTLQSFGLGRNRGHFVIPKVVSGGVVDQEQKIRVKFSGVYRATDKILVKYKFRDKAELPTPAANVSSGYAVWDSNNETFVVDGSYRAFTNMEEGDEVEFINCTGSGYITHIDTLNKTDNRAIYITTSETFPIASAGDLSEVIVDNYKLLGEINSESKNVEFGYAEFPFNSVTAKDILIKIELRGFNIKVEEVEIINTISKS